MMPWLGKTVSLFTGFQGSENSPPFNKASLLAGSKEFGLLAGYVYEGFRTGTAAQKNGLQEFTAACKKGCGMLRCLMYRHVK